MNKQKIVDNFFKLAKAEIIYILVIVAIWGFMVLLVNPIGDFPLNDDWAFGQAVKSVVEQGNFQLSGWGAMNLFSQVWWGALFSLPFGFSFTALRFSTLTLGLIGVITTYGLLREVNSSRKIALLGALIVAVNPIYFSLANTFMTDVPFFTLANLALFFLIRGLKHDSIAENIIGIILSYTALLIRQLGIAILFAFGCAYISKKGISIKTIAQGFLPTLLGIVLQILYKEWLRVTGRLPVAFGSSIDEIFRNFKEGNFHILIDNLIDKTYITLFYIGLFIFPFILLLFVIKFKQVSIWRNKVSLFVGSAIWVVLTGTLILKSKQMPLSGNVLESLGIGPLSLRDTYLGLSVLIIPTSMKILWFILTLIGAVGAVVLILYLMFSIWSLFIDFRLNKAWLKIFIVAAILTYFLPLGLSTTFFDRYLLWLIPLSMMFLSVSREVATENFIKGKISLVLISLASLMILFSGLFTVPATHDYLSWNRVRWQALNNLMQESKVQPNQIDGGFEFNGWYLYDSKYEKNPQKSWWWVDKDDYIISFELLNGYEQVKQYSLHKWLPFEPKKILVLRKINHLQQF